MPTFQLMENEALFMALKLNPKAHLWIWFPHSRKWGMHCHPCDFKHWATRISGTVSEKEPTWIP